MSVFIPITLLGRQLKTCAVYGGTADATGTVTWTLVGDLSRKSGIGSFESLQIVPRNMPIDVTPGDSPVTLNLVDKQDFSGSITEQRQSNGGEIIKQCAAAYQYICIESTYQPDAESGSTGLSRLAAMGLITDAPRGIQGGKNVMTVNFVSIGYSHFEGTGSLPAYFPS